MLSVFTGINGVLHSVLDLNSTCRSKHIPDIPGRRIINPVFGIHLDFMFVTCTRHRHRGVHLRLRQRRFRRAQRTGFRWRSQPPPPTWLSMLYVPFEAQQPGEKAVEVTDTEWNPMFEWNPQPWAVDIEKFAQWARFAGWESRDPSHAKAVKGKWFGKSLAGCWRSRRGNDRMCHVAKRQHTPWTTWTSCPSCSVLSDLAMAWSERRAEFKETVVLHQ